MGAERFERETGRWTALGRVFQSPYDWDYRPIERELLDMLDAPTLLRAFNFHVTHEEYGKDMAYLSASTLSVFNHFDARMRVLRHDLERHRKVVSDEGWDYHGKVKPFEDAQNRALRAEFSDALSATQREEVIVAALRYAEAERAKYAEEEPGDPYVPDVHLERWPDDPPFMTGHPYSSRNYDVFAVLGNVRNGTGFAGVDTGDAVPPISDCRGVPDDADPETFKLLSNEHSAHSATWVTLAELEAYDYDALKVHCGVVPAETYEVMRAIEQDDPYHPDVQAELDKRYPKRNLGGVSGWISGGGIVVFDPAGYEHWKQRGEPGVREPERTILSPDTPVDEEEVARQAVLDRPIEVRAHVQIRWATPLRDSLGDSYFGMIEALRGFVPEGSSAEDIRIVMDFDS